jgi:sugar phosphate isomerase/epimerase
MSFAFGNRPNPTSFASVSLQARPGSALPDKLRAIRSAGFDAVELGMPDLLEYSKKIMGEDVDPTDYATISTAAKSAKGLAAQLELELMMLQPFDHFEGWTKASHQKERADAFQRARGWMTVMEAAGINTLQVSQVQMGYTGARKRQKSKD